MSQPPRAPGHWPLVGHTVSFLRSPLSTLDRWGQTDAPVVSASVAGRQVVVVTDPRVARQVLVDASEEYQKAEILRERLGTLQGGSLVLLEGDAWRDRRSVVGSAFTADRVSTVDSVTAAYADGELADWPTDATVDLQATARDLTLAVLARALFGLDLRGGDTPIHAAADDVLARLRLDSPSTYLPEWVPTPTNRRFRRAVATLHARLDETVERQRRSDGSHDGHRARDDHDDHSDRGLLGTLVAAGLPTETIRDELIAFLFAGFDSTATALSCTLGLLAAHPRRQSSLAAAVDRSVGDRSLADASPIDCEPLDAVVRESLRLYPPQYLLFREPLSDVSLGGAQVTAGTPVVLAPWLYHRDSRFWDDPETFRPQRWLDGRDGRGSAADDEDGDGTAEGRGVDGGGPGLAGDDRPTAAYVPYGVGPRSCIGRRMADRMLRTAVAAVCRRYRLTPVDELTVAGGPTLALDGGVSVRVQPRE
ncbi:cytochrome P450 [Halobaculum sp. MBLA0143]|uniref:cytochrome P450 n=1 Tax=Halobaculum sp. MBLA0143 TaxID=3079933 RepID=UPI003523D33A